MPTADEQQPRESEPRWEQPGWSQRADDQAEPIEPEPILPDDVLTNAPLDVRLTPSAPSVVESTLRVVSAIVWPVAIAFSILGLGGGWVFNMAGAFLISAAASAIRGELRHRRRFRRQA